LHKTDIHICEFNILLRIVFPKTDGYSNEYQTVVIKFLLNQNAQNIIQ